ncbi:MAG: TIGR03000 domain-containing protein [Gemmataceae bacterium]|nr:TIGR03000 domain-containing protein [Gemmata sp.]MDW8199364.1 TIGR03000 domain-containing protein [Gemmataceae bacterium]
MRTIALALGAALVLAPEVYAQRLRHAEGGILAGAGGGRWLNNGYPNGPRVAPPWSYYGLAGGPFVGYPPWIGFPGAIGSFWTNGLSLYGPPVPTYGPLPATLGNSDLERAWRQHAGFAGYGWVGLYAASPRPKPPTVHVRPTVEALPPMPGVPPPATNPGRCLILSVKVPQPAAEVFVDGQPTTQTGTDRIFESPPLAAGSTYRYTITARWIERGQLLEMTREVLGTPGEVVRVDFTSSSVGAVGR